MSETPKAGNKPENDPKVPDVSGGYTPSPTDGCIVGPEWPPNDGAPGYPQNPFGPGGPYTDPFQDPAPLT